MFHFCLAVGEASESRPGAKKASAKAGVLFTGGPLSNSEASKGIRNRLE